MVNYISIKKLILNYQSGEVVDTSCCPLGRGSDARSIKAILQLLTIWKSKIFDIFEILEYIYISILS